VKKFHVLWKQFHAAEVQATDEDCAKTIAIYLGDVDTFESIGSVRVVEVLK